MRLSRKLMMMVKRSTMIAMMESTTAMPSAPSLSSMLQQHTFARHIYLIKIIESILRESLSWILRID